MKLFMVAAVVWSALVFAGPDCEDEFSSCSEDCTMEFGSSARDEMKKRFAKCQKKCTKKERLCTERAVETRSGQLDEGSLEKSTSSRDGDEFGSPKARPQNKASDSRKPRGDDTEKVQSKKSKGELEAEEIPKSTRSSLKTETPAETPKEAPKKKVVQEEKKDNYDDWKHL
jgi:glucan-binding YG repeat protein